MKTKKCNVPSCKHDEYENDKWKNTTPDPNCKCYGTWLINLMPGQHFHPCKVHPDVVIVGNSCSYM